MGFPSSRPKQIEPLPKNIQAKETVMRIRKTPGFDPSIKANSYRVKNEDRHHRIVPRSISEKKQRLLKNRFFLTTLIVFLLAPLGLIVYLLGRNFTGANYIRVSPPPGWQEASSEARMDAEANLRMRLRGINLDYLFYRSDSPGCIEVFSCDLGDSGFPDLPDTINIGEMETYLDGHKEELLQAFARLFTDNPQNMSVIGDIKVVALRNGNVGLDLRAVDNTPNLSAAIGTLVFRRGNKIYNLLIKKGDMGDTDFEMEYLLHEIYFG